MMRSNRIPKSIADLRQQLARRRRARGVTLFEVLIVVAILAMVAGGVAFFALPQFNKAKISTAESAARVIRQAAQSWQATNNETACPTISQLIQDKLLDSGQNTSDPWGQGFTISCNEEDVIVVSNGPDKKKSTKDDVVVPKQSAAPAGE
jgi:general secretion pathway protein G